MAGNVAGQLVPSLIIPLRCEETCGWALVKGHQEIFEWARANGAPWQEGTTATVGEAGGLLFHRT
jgi:hypothetical protein